MPAPDRLGFRLAAVLTILAIALAVTAISTAGYAGSWVGLLDLFSQFRVQFLGIVVLGAVAVAALRAWPALGLMAALVVVHALPVASLIVPAHQPSGEGRSLRLIQFNVLTSNLATAEAASWLVDQDPDLIVAQETDQRWADALSTGLPGWQRLPTDTIRSNNFGMAVFVRDGLDDNGRIGFSAEEESDTPAITTRIPVGDRTLLIYGVHAVAPVFGGDPAQGQRQLDTAAQAIRDHDGPGLIIGDLNATRWSSRVRRLSADTGLRDSANGFGLTGTWPSSLWYTGMITIDHVLVSDGIRVDGHRVGPDLGSDHRPVVVDLTVIDQP